MTGPDTHELTSSELLVLNCMAQGMAQEATATHLRMSPNQVKRRRAGIYRKLNASNNAHAVSLGYEFGLLPQSTKDVIRVINALNTRLPTPVTASTQPSSLSGKDTPR